VRRHETDVTSLVFGVIFAGVAAVWALVETDVVNLDNLTVLGPAVLVLAGLVGLVASLRGSRPRDDERLAEREAERKAESKAESEAELELEPHERP
jgi:hypothetical protein